MTGTTILALAAIAFSLLSFWAIWVRRGRLLCNSPAVIGWVRVPAGSVHVVVSVVLYNTGARALVVEAMELRLLPQQQTLVWGFTRDPSPSTPTSAAISRAHSP